MITSSYDVEQDNVRESWNANVSDAGWSASKAIRVVDSFDDSRFDQLDKDSSKSHGPLIVPFRCFPNVTIE
jgi:hypothetical protein